MDPCEEKMVNEFPRATQREVTFCQLSSGIFDDVIRYTTMNRTPVKQNFTFRLSI